ncbi:MAG TPA: hypothetical protein ENO39_00780 [Fervidicoccus fontis]|uniref:Uncharacterized protein n=2 Tax=Fervidicoccus fontis TaxID=683846 RepID=A0A7C2VII1_9CREN|nr:hypothetical protein [Fervidicoccus fontis]
MKKVNAVRVGEYWVIEFQVCHSLRSCRDTKYMVRPQDKLRYIGSRRVALFLKNGEKALELYRQWSFNGNLKWNNLCLYEAKEDGVYEMCFGYDEYSSVQTMVDEAKNAYRIISQSGIDGWKEILSEWWSPAENRLFLPIDSIVR